MQIVEYPKRNEWEQLLQRPVLEQLSLAKMVKKLLLKVKEGGDKAVRKMTKDFDGVKIKKLLVSKEEIEQAIATVADELKEAITIAASNITSFHQSQLLSESLVETMPGVKCWRRSVAISKVGLYIPGGTAPLFSTVLMLGIPAKLAGCKEIVLCTPPQKDGTINPAVLFTARLAGITKIFKAGGAQAIAAMAYGTESIPKVDKIFGPGNQYVTCAKQMIQSEGIAIDMPAGPSEVCVLADETGNPSFIAADLLSQAEHGADSQTLLVTTSPVLADQVKAEVEKQVKELPREKFALASLANSKAIVLESLEDSIDLVNEYAAEHLIISCADDESIAQRITNAGSVFLGNYSPESAGDYASGTNHTLPTNGFARSYSGVSVDSFVKKITYQKLSKEGLANIGKTVELMAKAEGLDAHARAVSIRLKN
ncbi:histidinol dehydrogenase [Terrimonas pollutisoli]|uniref:histidinol dehydrogenase n=1 Tax=Terrimonas pollutisoli TaxID=3034147 RepID=UPI0023EC47E9|nr:histidinol dehydrogenase [Terrimonas sp. H1YJ31]